ncbi:unnamed protein product [Closterium sp. NIES-54]
MLLSFPSRAYCHVCRSPGSQTIGHTPSATRQQSCSLGRSHVFSFILNFSSLFLSPLSLETQVAWFPVHMEYALSHQTAEVLGRALAVGVVGAETAGDDEAAEVIGGLKLPSHSPTLLTLLSPHSSHSSLFHPFLFPLSCVLPCVQVAWFPDHRAYALSHQTAEDLVRALAVGVVGAETADADEAAEVIGGVKLPSRRPALVSETCLFLSEPVSEAGSEPLSEASSEADRNWGNRRVRAFHVLDSKGMIDTLGVFVEEREGSGKGAGEDGPEARAAHAKELLEVRLGKTIHHPLLSPFHPVSFATPPSLLIHSLPSIGQARPEPPNAPVPPSRLALLLGEWDGISTTHRSPIYGETVTHSTSNFFLTLFSDGSLGLRWQPGAGESPSLDSSIPPSSSCPSLGLVSHALLSPSSSTIPPTGPPSMGRPSLTRLTSNVFLTRFSDGSPGARESPVAEQHGQEEQVGGGGRVVLDGGQQITLLPGGLALSAPCCVPRGRAFFFETILAEPEEGQGAGVGTERPGLDSAGVAVPGAEGWRRRRVARTYDPDGLVVSSSVFAERKMG